MRISYDDGVTWAKSRALSSPINCDYNNTITTRAGYTSMAKTADYHIGALVELNEDITQNETSSKSIEFHKFSLEWILNGTVEP
ncbi:sialidase family protein [Pedobacter immunditicola]|uniref:sialidase family protein n=1 Tax=Pedobacter immunditicola TaxID=3133440 RepID=UPI0030AD1564